MAKIKLSEGGYTLIPEGTTTFKIVEVEYKEDFGKMKVILQTKSGQKHTEQYSFLNKNRELNQGALNAFSYFAKTALNNFTINEIDEQDLVGCYVTARVEHYEYESTKEPGTMKKSSRLKDFAVAVGFGSGSTVEESEIESDDVDLDSFLDD